MSLCLLGKLGARDVSAFYRSYQYDGVSSSRKKNQLRELLKSLIVFIFFVYSSSLHASFTANKVWFEYHQGFYRVIVHYTVPELKELREATFDVVNKRKAEIFYFSLLRGAHFQLSSPEPIGFHSQEKKADPW